MSSKSPKKFAFALGGLAGNNAHGAGFLHGALAQHLEPVMISCTSGQIYWVYEYLQARSGDRERVRETFYKQMEDLHQYHNINVDFGRVATFGYPGVFRWAYPEYPADLASNWGRAATQLLTAPARSFWAKEWAGVLPGRILVPDFPDGLFEAISTAFRQETIGIAFNSYCPSEGKEFVYLNDAARGLLARDTKKYGPEYKSRTRGERTFYKEITPGAIESGLWLYEYGFEDPARQTVDGAYYRQIMLKELTGADVIFVARPINRVWLPASTDGTVKPDHSLPHSYIEIQDLKTEINFNGSYMGERAQIELINRLVEERDKAVQQNPAGGGVELLKDYHRIDLVEIEIDVQRGFFDYVFESPDVFDHATQAIERSLKSAQVQRIMDP